MRYKHIINLLSMRDKYHPLRDRLFRKYRFPAITMLMNFIVGGSCFLLLMVAFYGLFSFFYTLDDNTILRISGSMVFIFSFVATIKSIYDFMYSGKDISLLKVLPITKSEILASDFIFFYKKQFLISLYLMSTAMLAILKKNFKINFLIIGILIVIIIPFLAIVFSMILSAIVHIIASKMELKKRHKKLIFKKTDVLSALIIYEIKNLRNFSSLKVEILMQFFFSLALASSSAIMNYKLVSLVIIYPVLSMINISSFSREGQFHIILQALPINVTNRIFAKVIFYLLICISIVIGSFCYTYIRTKELVILLSLIPNIIFIVGLSILCVKAGRNSLNIYWINPQDAFRMNYPILFLGFVIAFFTEVFIFFPDLLFISNSYFGLLLAILLNVMFLVYSIIRK